jgi:hypothetical protein
MDCALSLLLHHTVSTNAIARPNTLATKLDHGFKATSDALILKPVRSHKGHSTPIEHQFNELD